MPKQVVVSPRAVLARVRRMLAGKGQDLVADRRGGRHGFLLVDTAKGMLLKERVALEDIARELGVMKGWEVLR